MHVQKHSPYDWNRQVMFPSIDYKHNNRFNDSNKFMVSVDLYLNQILEKVEIVMDILILQRICYNDRFKIYCVMFHLFAIQCV